jgi:hypothetical protein
MKWHLGVVYGLAQPEDKEELLKKNVDLCNKCTWASVDGGDFNISRKTNETNKPFIFLAGAASLIILLRLID